MADQEWGPSVVGRRVIVHDKTGAETARGTITSYIPPAEAQVSVEIDGGDKYQAATPVSMVELEAPAPQDAVDAITSISGISAARAAQVFQLLRRAGYDITPRTQETK